MSTSLTSDSAEGSSEPDEPTVEELAAMRAATPLEAAAVDALVLGACDHRWRKVAMVVGALLDRFDSGYPHLPFVYLQARMLELEDQGRLEVRGDVMAMRHSEVRLRS